MPPRAALGAASKRLFRAAFSPALPALVIARMTLMAFPKRRAFGAHLKALPLTIALIL